MKNKNQKKIILESAKKLFSKFGIQKTTMQDIATDAKLGKSTLYYYFKNKEEIYENAFMEELSEIKSKILCEINKKSDPIEKLKCFIISRLNCLSDFAIYWTVQLENYLSCSSLFKKLKNKAMEMDNKIIRKILMEGAKKGIFNSKDMEVAIFFLNKAIIGLQTVGIAEMNIKKEAEGIINLILYGLIKNEFRLQ